MSLTIDKIAWIEIKDKKILVARSKGKETFYIPGGKREAGESDQQTLIREIEEELSVSLKPESVKYYGTFSAQAHGHSDGIMVQMTCYKGKYDGEMKAASQIDEISWLPFDKMNQTSHVDKTIFKDLRTKGLL